MADPVGGYGTDDYRPGYIAGIRFPTHNVTEGNTVWEVGANIPHSTIPFTGQPPTTTTVNNPPPQQPAPQPPQPQGQTITTSDGQRRTLVTDPAVISEYQQRKIDLYNQATGRNIRQWSDLRKRGGRIRRRKSGGPIQRAIGMARRASRRGRV
jgi:hypothetical protein